MTRLGLIRLAAIAAIVAAVGCSGWALAQTARTPEQSIAFRKAQFRRVGEAFKAVNDGLRAGQPNLETIRGNAQTLVQLSLDQPTWFPAGSGPSAGVQTRAKPEIWSNSAAFAERMAAFRAAAQDLAGATAGSDIAAMRTQARALGARCASCHTDFRTPE